MTYLIARANYNNENRGDEFSPTHFVMEIDPPIIKYLHNLLKEVKKIKKHVDLIHCSFHFGFGIWTQFDKWLFDNCHGDYTYYQKEELPIQCEEQDYLTLHHITMNAAGDIQFLCSGKWDDERIYTCGFNLFEFQKELGDQLFEAL